MFLKKGDISKTKQGLGMEMSKKAREKQEEQSLQTPKWVMSLFGLDNMAQAGGAASAEALQSKKVREELREQAEARMKAASAAAGGDAQAKGAAWFEDGSPIIDEVDSETDDETLMNQIYYADEG